MLLLVVRCIISIKERCLDRWRDVARNNIENIDGLPGNKPSDGMGIVS